MTTLNKLSLPITSEKDVVISRIRVKDYAAKLGLSTLDQTKLMTATSELARNILLYAESGKVTIWHVFEGVKKGVKVIFEDSGPGIPNVNQAMQDGYSTRKSLGLGLPGAKRLVNYFDIHSKLGHGTKITIIRWGR